MDPILEPKIAKHEAEFQAEVWELYIYILFLFVVFCVCIPFERIHTATTKALRVNTPTDRCGANGMKDIIQRYGVRYSANLTLLNKGSVIQFRRELYHSFSIGY